jgi:hypothetical protein
MNRASWMTMVFGALLLGCGAGMVAHEVIESQVVHQAEAQSKWTGQRWEYRCDALDKNPMHLTEPEGVTSRARWHDLTVPVSRSLARDGASGK